MKTNIRLTMLSIIRVEQLLKKPFTELDYSDQDDLTSVLYCMLLACNEERFTIEVFKSMMESDRFAKDIMKAFENEGKIIAQFNEQQKESKGDSEGQSAYVKDLASMLIIGGLDADYVMNKMEVCDLYMMLDSFNSAKKEKMESDRLWTYLTMLPHMDSKKVKSPQDIYPFPWEAEEMQQTAEASLQENAEYFEKFINGEIKFNLEN